MYDTTLQGGIDHQLLYISLSGFGNDGQQLFQMSEIYLPLPAPDSEAFSGAFSSLIDQVLKGTPPDFTIRQYLRAIFTCAIKYNNQQSVSFLLQLPWFTQEFAPHLDILDKLLRWYRGKGKECTTVCYTLLVEGFISSKSQILVIQCILKLLEGRYDHAVFLNSLKDMFPHKNRPLEHHSKFIKACLQVSQRKPNLRAPILEIIIEKLSTFDTEIKSGDSLINRPFLENSDTRMKIREPTELESKFDNLMIMLLDYVEVHPQIKELSEQLLLIFHRKILLMDQNKYIQYIMFYVSQSKKQVRGYFLSILINTLIQQNQVAYQKAYINNVFFLGSYLVRSSISQKRLKSAMQQIITYSRQLIQDKPDLKVQGLLLNEIVKQNQHFLYIYQTILYVFVHKPQIYKVLLSQFNPLFQLANKKCCSDILINSQIMYRFNRICKRSNQEYSQPDLQYLTFENKFNPILLQKLKIKIQPFYIAYQYQSVLQELAEPGKRKRCYSIDKSVHKKLKRASEEHISDTSTMYNR